MQCLMVDQFRKLEELAHPLACSNVLLTDAPKSVGDERGFTVKASRSGTRAPFELALRCH